MINRKMMQRMKKTGAKSVAGILVAISIMSTAVPAFADTTDTASVASTTAVAEVASTDEDQGLDEMMADMAENTAAVEDAEESSAAEDAAAEADAKETDAEETDAEETEKAGSSEAEDQASLEEEEKEPEIDQKKIEEQLESTSPVNGLKILQLAVSGSMKLIPFAGTTLSCCFDYLVNALTAPGTSKEEEQLRQISSQLDSMLAQLKKDEKWKEYAEGIRNTNTYMDAMLSKMRTDSRTKPNMEDVKREYLTDLQLLEQANGDQKKELEQKLQVLSARILAQNTFTDGEVVGNDFWTSMDLLKTYIIGDSNGDVALFSNKSVFDKTYEYQCSLNKFRTKAGYASVPYQTKIYESYVAVQAYAITTLENKLMYGYNLSDDTIKLTENRIEALKSDLLEVSAVMNKCAERENSERNLYGDKKISVSQVDFSRNEAAYLRWNESDYKEFLAYMKEAYNDHGQGMTVRAFLENDFGLSIPSYLRYIRVTNYTPVNHIGTTVRAEFNADVIYLDNSSMQTGTENIGLFESDPAGRNQYFYTSEWGIYAGNVSIN